MTLSTNITFAPSVEEAVQAAEQRLRALVERPSDWRIVEADFSRFKPNYADKHGVRGLVVFEKWRSW